MRNVFWADAILLAVIGAIVAVSATETRHFYAGAYWVGVGFIGAAALILLALVWTSKAPFWQSGRKRRETRSN